MDQLKADKKREKSLWKIDIELREPWEEEEEDNHESVDYVLDDTAPNSSDSKTKQVTFDTTVEITDSSTMTDQQSPKKSSRVAWQDHVEVME